MIQSASTPPPSPPIAKMAMVMGRVRARGAFIVASPTWRSGGNQLAPNQTLLQEADDGVADAHLEAIPAARIIDDRGAVERRTQHGRVRDLTAQSAADTGVDHLGDRLGAQRIGIGGNGQ